MNEINSFDYEAIVNLVNEKIKEIEKEAEFTGVTFLYVTNDQDEQNTIDDLYVAKARYKRYLRIRNYFKKLIEEDVF